MNNKIFRFYYGWVIVAISTFTIFLALGTRISFGVYYIAIIEEFGWGRAETAGAFSLAMVFHAIFSPVTGMLIDRFGPRKLFPLGAFLLFLGLLAASRISSIWHLYIFFGVVIAIGINTLSFSPHMSLIPKWFIKKKGLASGLVASGAGLGAIVLVPFNELMISALGWRSAFLILSGIVLFILIPVTVLFYRNSPREIGQSLDGIVPKDDENSPLQLEKNDPLQKIQELWTFKDAILVRGFWFIMLAVICEGFIVNMLLVHQAVYIVDMGYSKILAASLIGLVGILGSAGGILCGFLSDHTGSKFNYTLGSILSFTGILFLLFVNDSVSFWMLYTFALLYGFGTGGKLPIIAIITGDLFPGDALGRIMATQAIGFGIGGAIGAYLGGYFYDQTGTYFVPFSLLLASIILGVFFIFMTVPRKLQISRNTAT